MQTKFKQRNLAKYLLTIILIVSGYLILFVFSKYSNNQHITVCVFKSITGIPCPGCGMGRATIQLFKGNLIKSFDYNILCIPFTIIIIISICWLMRDIILRKDTFFQFMKQDIKKPYKIGLVILLIFDWAVNIARHI